MGSLRESHVAYNDTKWYKSRKTFPQFFLTISTYGDCSMFRHPALCSDNPTFQLLNLCSDNPMFRQPALKIVLALDWCVGAREQPMFRFITPRDLQGHAISLQARYVANAHVRGLGEFIYSPVFKILAL